MKALELRILLAVATSLALLSTSSCQSFDPAHDASLAGDSNGVMTTAPDAPLVLELSEPVVRSTLRIKVVSLAVPGAVDGEGNLLDEQNPPRKQAFKDSTVIAYDGAHTGDANATYGARFQLDRLARFAAGGSLSLRWRLLHHRRASPERGMPGASGSGADPFPSVSVRSKR